MPSVKTGTVVNQVGPALKNMVGGSEYRERVGCIRMAVGQLGFTPDEMQRNIKSFIESLKKDIAQLSDRIGKDIHEVVSSFASISRQKIANNDKGSQFNTLSRIHIERRFQGSPFDTRKGPVWPLVSFSCSHSCINHMYHRLPTPTLCWISCTCKFKLISLTSAP